MDSNNPNAALKRKLQKLYEIKLENPELVHSLKDLSTFYVKNTLENRWNLRDVLENRAFNEQKNFLESFDIVEKELFNVMNQINELQQICRDMEQRISVTKSSSGKLLEQAEKLFQANHQNSVKREVLSQFLSRFQLTSEELKILTSSEMSPQFFETLNRVNQIRNDCKVLLRSQHQRIGLEIMDLTSDYLEVAYKKLYKWIRNECKRCLDKDSPEISSLLRLAFHSLQDRPVLLTHCLEEVASTRENVLVRGFINALTRGGPTSAVGMPRPIELHAHDPQRYVSDMSAWIHQAVVSEEELIRTLLNLDITKTPSSSSSLSQQARENHENVLCVLNASFVGICRPFKMRIENVLSTKPTVVVTYHLINLLDFYSRRFKRILGNDSVLVKTFEEAKSDCFKFFFELLKKISEKRKRAPPIPPSDLSPPHELHETVVTLLEILSTVDSSLVPQEERDSEITPILENILEPTLQVIQSGGSNLNKIEQCVYLLNCLVTLEGILSKFGFVKTYLNRINTQMTTLLQILVDEQSSALLKECGLSSKLNILKFATTQSQGPLSQIPGMEPAAIKTTLRSFESSLLDFTSFSTMTTVNRLISTQQRKHVHSAVADLITQSYSVLFNAVMDPKNGYENPHSLFRYKPEQIRTMIEP